MRDILISRKRWKTVRVGGVGGARRRPASPKRGGTSEEEGWSRRGGLHRQINTRYFNGWEMRVCFAAYSATTKTEF